MAGVALCDIQTCFVTCRKSFFWQAQYFFQQMRCSCPSRRSTLDVSIVILRGRRSTLDVSCCVFFCESHCQGQVVTRCKFPGRRCILWDVMKIDGSLARNIDFEVNLEVHKKTRRKTPILKLQSVKIGVARNARFDAPTHLVLSLWFSCGLAVSMGKPLFFEGFQAGCHIFFLCRHGTWWHSNLFHNVSKVVLCGRRQIFASFSQDELHFSWQGQHFGDLCRHFAWQAQHFRRVALRALHSTLYIPHFTLHALHSTLYTLHSTLHALHSTLYTPHSTLYTIHFTLHTTHSTLYTPHFTLYTPHFALHTPHFTLHTLHCILYAPHFTLHTFHSTLYAPHSTLYTLHSTLYTPFFTLLTVHSTLHT